MIISDTLKEQTFPSHWSYYESIKITQNNAILWILLLLFMVNDAIGVTGFLLFHYTINKKNMI